MYKAVLLLAGEDGVVRNEDGDDEKDDAEAAEEVDDCGTKAAALLASNAARAKDLMEGMMNRCCMG